MDAVDVGELIGTLLKKYESTAPSESSLEQPELVHDVLARAQRR